MDEAVGKVLRKLRRRARTRTRSSSSSATTAARRCRARPSTARGTLRSGARSARRWKAGIRVPFVLRGRALKPASLRPAGDPARTTATSLAAAGVDVQADWKLDGVNLLPYLTGEETAAPHERSTGASASRWPSAWATTSSSATTAMPTRHRAATTPATDAKLYDLADDIGERKTWTAMPDKVQRTSIQVGRLERDSSQATVGQRRKDNDGPEPGCSEDKKKASSGKTNRPQERCAKDRSRCSWRAGSASLPVWRGITGKSRACRSPVAVNLMGVCRPLLTGAARSRFPPCVESCAPFFRRFPDAS